MSKINRIQLSSLEYFITHTAVPMLMAEVFNATAVKLSWFTDSPPNGIKKEIVYEVFHFASSIVNVTRNSSKFYSVVVQVDDSSLGLAEKEHRFELKQRMGDEYIGNPNKAQVKFGIYRLGCILRL